MIEVVVFGKPRSFESYGFSFEETQGSQCENSHSEPVIKPITGNDIVLHYYKKDDIAVWEAYRHCKGFDSERPGIVLGVGFKSDKDFGLLDTYEELLVPFWKDFAVSFLDENFKFKFDRIVGYLKNTTWSDEERCLVQSKVSQVDKIRPCQERPLLLLVAENDNGIQSVEDSIKEYRDVYIANNMEIFRNAVNVDVLRKQANNEIHIVKGGKIELFEESEGGEQVEDQNVKKRWFQWNWDKEASDSSSDPNTNDGNGKNKEPDRLPKLVATAAAILFVVIVTWMFVSKPKPADRLELAIPPTSGYITDSFDLTPKLIHGKMRKTSTKIEDVKWKIEGEGSKYVEFDTTSYSLKVNDNYRNDKPSEKLSIIVIAMLDGKELVNNKYELKEYKRPKANRVELSSCSTSIRKSWKIEPKLFCDKDPDVSTKLREIEFKVQPEGIAYVGDEFTLIVSDRQNEDTKITVTAYLGSEQIGSQNYTIAKAETVASPENEQVTGIIECKPKTDDDSKYRSISFYRFTIDNITTYNFIAKPNDEKKFDAGGWKCEGLEFSSSNNDGETTQNPMSIKSVPASGTYELQYWVAGKKEASSTISITD